MKVIVCGAGQVGFGIARHLAGEGNDVTVVDREASLMQRITDTLDVRPILGMADIGRIRAGWRGGRRCSDCHRH